MIKALLDAKSYFSLMWGVRSPADVVCKVAELGYDAVALTDRDGLYGLPEFLGAARRQGIRPIVAAEVTDPATSQSVLLYPQNTEGYANLCRILTERYKGPQYQRVSCAPSGQTCGQGVGETRPVEFNLARTLGEHGSGLAMVTDRPELLRRLSGHPSIFFRMGHSLRRPPAEVRHLPAVIAPPALFFDRDDGELHRLLRAIDLKERLSSIPSCQLADADSVFLSWDRIVARFSAMPEAIEGTQHFIDTLRFDADFSETLFPEFPCPPDMSVIDLLRCKVYEGARRRYASDGSLSPPVVERIERELDQIEIKGFAPYFLVVDEIVRRSPRTCGRGSAAASIVSYCLGITNVDPIQHNLMFERFLNPGRTDPPDIDVDFAWDERDEVLDWVLNRYGLDHAAMVANHIRFRPRMALRETARVFGLPERQIGEVTLRLPWFWQTDDLDDLDAIVRTAPRLAGVALDPPWPDILRMAGRLIGIPRGLSVHCGGVVLTPGPIWQRVPIRPAHKGVNIVHWDKDGVEELGLVKIDLLGNRSLAVIRDAIANIRGQGMAFDETRWAPIDDPATQQLLAGGRTMGVFYVESPSMRQLQIKTGRGDFDHLVINTSIIRPAANAYTQEYVRRVHGAPYAPIHPLLKDLLCETYGIMVYQEDVSRVAMALAGFSCEQADRLRKIMSKKDKHLELAHFYRQFVEGARQKGIDDAVIEEVWRMILAFSGYSFCKPHSASYTMVSYESAYLKAHFPAEFLAAVMANHGGYYRTQAYVSEARRWGVEVLPPDVNLSEPKFRAHDHRIVTGLEEIKGLSEAARQQIVEERRARGPFSGLEDFLARTDIDAADVRRLILIGAFDRIESVKNRPSMLWHLKVAARRPVVFVGGAVGRDGSYAERPRSKRGGTTRSLGVSLLDVSCLHAGEASGHPSEPDAPSLRDYAVERKHALEFDLLGFFCGVHPLDVFAPALPRVPSAIPWVKACRLQAYAGRHVRILSWPVSSKTISTAGGQDMEFVSFEDQTDLYEAVLFPREYRRYTRLLVCDAPLIVTGRVDCDFGAISVVVEHITAV